MFNTAHEKGIVVVAAAGNDNLDTTIYPAAYNHVIAVGATNKLNQKARFSNYGDFVDVMAPGVDIRSSDASALNAYVNLQGTSMATPLVAALAGLILKVDESLSPDLVETVILSGCQPVDPGILNLDTSKFGAGRIDAYQSMLNLINSSIAPEFLSGGFHIYPNPTTGLVHIDGPGFQSAVLTIFNLSGIEVLKSFKGQLPADFDLQHLPAGNYVLRVQQDQDVAYHRIVKLD
jgi:subtilisin family serine protease